MIVYSDVLANSFFFSPF